MERIEVKVGDEFGRLVVTRIVDKTLVDCICTCPLRTRLLNVKRKYLLKGKGGCNCLKDEANKRRAFLSPVGQVYGILRVLIEIDPIIRPNGKKRRRVLAQCLKELGGCNRVKPYQLDNLKAKNNTVSCGECEYSRERTRKRFTKHGKRNHPLYPRHRQMMLRVYDPKCKQFKTYQNLWVEEYLHDVSNYVNHMTDPILFPNWKEEVAAGKTVDREDNSLGYERGNLRYLSPEDQNRNKGNNVWIYCRGEILCQVDVCKKFNIIVETFRYRIDRGWNIEVALLTKQRWPGKRPKNYNQPINGDIFFIEGEK